MRGSELLDSMELVDAAYVMAADAQPQKRTWRRWTAVAATFCLILGALAFGVLRFPAFRNFLLYGRTYVLTCENGNYFAAVENLYNFSSQGASSVHGMQIKPNPIEFQSMAEMRDDIRNGRFTDKEHDTLLFWADRGKVPLPNIDSLLEPVYPAAAGDYYISLNRFHYTCIFSKPQFAARIQMTFDHNLSVWEQKVAELTNVEELLDVYKKEAEGDGTTYYYTSGKRYHVAHIYSFAENGTVYYVREQYSPAGYSQKTPEYVEVYFAETGADFYSRVYMTVPKERPGRELIASFSWKEYVAE